MAEGRKKYKALTRKKRYKGKYSRRVRQREKIINLAANITALFLVVILVFFTYGSLSNKRVNLKQNSDYIAAMRISYNDFSSLRDLSAEYGVDFPQALAYYFVENNFFKGVPVVNSDEFLRTEFLDDFRRVRRAYSSTDIEPLEEMFRTLLSEIVCFPIPANFKGQVIDDFVYGDTWGAGHGYGGDRIHLGTDIIDRRNIRGRIPIVSMSDGRIIHAGWNTLGGFHVGIISDGGIYYYYAHLAEFAPGIVPGVRVVAGDLIGLMGDTGYSSVEGTTGNMIVHLHVGIAYNAQFAEDLLWVNPYILLRNVENNRVTID